MSNEGAPLCTLEQFPRIPRKGNITVAESHSEIHSLPSTPDNPCTGMGFCPMVEQYAAVNGHQLRTRLPFKIPSIRMTSGRDSLIVERQQSVSKALWDAWWEDGIHGMYRCLSSIEASRELGTATKFFVKVVGSTSALFVKLFEVPTKIMTSFYPHLGWTVEETNEEFSHVRRWRESWIRAIAWHPTTPHLAMALDDDTVRCNVVGTDMFPMFRCHEQRNVSCLAWRPYLMTELAVGCEDCIVVWRLTPSGSMKAGKDKSRIIKEHGHGPVNSLQYTSDGMYLLSSSANDTCAYIWDAIIWSQAALRRIAGQGIPLSLWSSESNRILAASPSHAFWVWENDLDLVWRCKRWNTPNTRIEAACWNPGGNILLFATGGFIYAQLFELSPVDRFVAQQESVVKPVYNIEECHVFDTDENLEYKVGGKVRQMEWDSSGHRVAVMFDDSDLIALFRVLPKSHVELLTPLGFVRGHQDESPSAIAFQKDFTEGALLTIAWNSGRIQHFPMIFALPTTTRNILHHDHYRAQQQVVHGRPSHFPAAGFVSPRVSVSGVEPSVARSPERFVSEGEQTSSTRLYSLLSPE